jgi:hypothetical protein
MYRIKAQTCCWVDNSQLQRRLPAKAKACIVDLVRWAAQCADNGRLLAAEPAGGARPEEVCRVKSTGVGYLKLKYS